MILHWNRIAGVVFTLFLIGPTAAQDARYDWNVNGVHIVAVEATYMPGAITFQADVAVSATCPVGTWLTWPAQGADTQSQQANTPGVFSLLLAAKISQITVNLYGRNNGCTVNFIHMQ